MKWLNNMESIAQNNKAGICPICKSQDTDFSIKRSNNNIGYGDIWCNNCKNAYHISRLKVDDNIIRNKPVPTDIRY